MNAPDKAPPHGEPSSRPPRLRRLFGGLGLAAVVAYAWLRAIGRERRARRDRVVRSVVSEEVIIVFPTQAWQGARSEATEAALELVVRRMGRWQVSLRPPRLGEKRLRGLRRSYLCLAMKPGFEDDVLRAVKVAAWSFGLPRGRGGLFAVRSPLIAPATNTSPPGQIAFTPEYLAAKATIGAVGASAAGVSVLVVDVDRPALDCLPAEIACRVEVLDSTNEEIEDGHATLIAAVVADVAKDATIKTLSIGDVHGAGFWALLDVLLSAHQADVIVASVSAPEGGRSKDGWGRENVFDSSLRSRRYEPLRPPILCPTGNHKADDAQARLDTIAIPARFDSVIAIGALDPSRRRAAGSRYGSKKGNDASAWWLAPGGAFDKTRIETPLVLMGGHPYGGTSIANAMAGGLAALAIRKLRARPAPADPERETAMRLIIDRLRATPGAEESLVMAESMRRQQAGEITHGWLAEELDSMSHPEHVANHNALEHGRGLLCLE